LRHPCGGNHSPEPVEGNVGGGRTPQHRGPRKDLPALGWPAREPRPPARRAYAPEGTKEKVSMPAAIRDNVAIQRLLNVTNLMASSAKRQGGICWGQNGYPVYLPFTLLNHSRQGMPPSFTSPPRTQALHIILSRLLVQTLSEAADRPCKHHQAQDHQRHKLWPQDLKSSAF
jgi:hypothetical protein